MKIVFLLFTLLTLSAPILAQDKIESLQHDDHTRTFLVHLPPSYDGTRPVPLLLALHPSGSNGRQMQRISGFDAVADQVGFIVVYPDGLRGFWDYGTGLPEYKYDDAIDDAAFLSTLIDQLTTEFTIDPERIYAAGYSNGAHMAYRLACVLPDKITAIASVAGSVTDFVADACTSTEPVSVLMIHGKADTVLPWAGKPLHHETTGEVLGQALAAPQGAEFWATHNQCELANSMLKAAGADGVSVVRYPDCAAGSEVVLLGIEDGGHTWPDGSFGGNTAALIWSFFAAYPAAQTPPSTAPTDLRRTYEVYVPSTYDKNEPLPLLLVLHGAGGDGASISQITGFNELAEREGFIVVYPDAVGGRWNYIVPTLFTPGIDDMSFLSELVDAAIRDIPVDPERVYVAGYSNGGMMAYAMACHFPGKFAGVASVGSTLPQSIAETCADDAFTAVLVVHGTLDPIIYWGQPTPSGRDPLMSIFDTMNFWAQHHACTVEPTITDLPDVDPDDETRVHRIAYGDCQAAADVVLYGIEGGGHTWPGHPIRAPFELGPTSSDIDASVVIWDFFAAHTQPAVAQPEATPEATP
jgi:polyhydroxybutyrate depolymerase